MEEQRDQMSSAEQAQEQAAEQREELAATSVEQQEGGAQAEKAETARGEVSAPDAEGMRAPLTASVENSLAEREADEAQEDEEEPAESEEDRTSTTTMGFDTLCNLFREKSKQDPVGDARREVQQIYEALFRQLKLQRDEERRQWLAAGHALVDFEPVERPIEQELKDIYDGFQRRRKEFMAREDDLRQENLRKKREIIAKIEALTQQEEVKGETFNKFDELRKAWREIGPVPRAEAEDLYQSYSHQTQQFYDYIDLNRELRDLDYKKNLEAKTALCERAEELIAEEDVRKAFKELQTLHVRWKELGPVARDKSDEIWERFSAASIRINQAYRELMQERKTLFAKNLAVRKEIVSQMETLMGEKREKQSDWISTTAKVMALQKAFKEAFPVARSQSNIGDVFFSMCSEFFEHRRAYEKAQAAIGRENAEKKQELCVQAEALKESDKWRDTKEELIALQRKWKEIGYTPRKVDQQLWERFKAAQDYFFTRRSKAFESHRDEEQANERLREALIEELEAYQPGEDGKAMVEQLKEFQARWGKIGHVPMRSREGLYRRFRAALDKHYDYMRRERKEVYAKAYEAKLDTMAEHADSGQQLTAERNKISRRLDQLLAEKNQLETNMSFFGKRDQNNPLLQKTRQDVERIAQEIESVKHQIKEINVRIRAASKSPNAGSSVQSDK